MGDAQGGRVGVRAIRDHPVEDVVAGRQPVTGQEPHDTGVTVVELDRDRRAAERRQEPLRLPAQGVAGGGGGARGTHRQHGVEEVGDEGGPTLHGFLRGLQVGHRVSYIGDLDSKCAPSPGPHAGPTLEVAVLT